MILHSSEFDIDAVITWVDGNDKVWQDKINQYKNPPIDFNKKQESVRYNSIGEINIAIQSIIKFASFIKNIYLVTDNQKPKSFDELKKLAKSKNINLELVDHTIIFKNYESLLPTFNSCSIGSLLYRIPNLSEHFIIFNDDTFLMRETKITDFFINGYPIIRGKKELFYEDRKLRKFVYKILKLFGKDYNKKKSGFKNFQQTSAKLAGVKSYVRRFHTPVAVRKSTLNTFFKENENLLKNNIKYKFRNKNQFIVSSLSEHLEISNNTYHFRKDTQLTYFRSYKNYFLVQLKLFFFEKNTTKLFMTFQSLELANQKIIHYILNWINHRLNL